MPSATLSGFAAYETIDLGSVAAEIEAKLIRRHAHIFGDDVAETAGDVRDVWERVKREDEGREGVFHNVPGTLPALLLALPSGGGLMLAGQVK